MLVSVNPVWNCIYIHIPQWGLTYSFVVFTVNVITIGIITKYTRIQFKITNKAFKGEVRKNILSTLMKYPKISKYFNQSINLYIVINLSKWYLQFRGINFQDFAMAFRHLHCFCYSGLYSLIPR